MAVDVRNAVLLLDKPSGMTSAAVVGAVQRILGHRKIGHSGTLDRFATGLLVLCTGGATKLTRFFLDGDKRYEGTARLGVVTETDDGEGTVISRVPVGEISDALLAPIRERFLGSIEQVPPRYSALKIAGRRASDRMRSGDAVDLAARRVVIHALELQRVPGDPTALGLAVTCSKGTYIRSLVRDMGECLGTGAHLEALRRMGSGRFSVDAALSLDALREDAARDAIPGRGWMSPFDALSDFGLLGVDEDGAARVCNGATLERQQVSMIEPSPGRPFRVMDRDNNMIAIAELDPDNWTIRYLNVFKEENKW
jgi:tRNA pseudouridine55 synthase